MERTITLPWPDARLNPHAKGSWWPKAEATKKARYAAWAACLEPPRIACMPDAEIFIEYYPSARRGDVHNVPAKLKAYIDGIADAMQCDDRNFRIHYPTEWAGTRKPGAVVLRILPPLGSGEIG